MNIYPRESVILANDFTSLMNWYKDVLGFKSTLLVDDEYQYCNLETETGILIGIANAAQMGVKNPNRKNNTILLQFEVEDVKEFFSYLEKSGGVITFGPSFDKKDKFWYGGFEDPEGNPFWVVDKNCP